MILRPEPLTAEAFAAFGRVIGFDAALGRSVNEGTALRADTQALFDSPAGSHPRLAIYRTRAQQPPFALSLFERHPEAAQTFIAISVPRFVVVVAPAGQRGLPHVQAARAFVGEAGMGFSYHVNQWHTPVMALGGDGDLAMLMSEHGDERDCVEHRVATPILIHP